MPDYEQSLDVAAPEEQLFAYLSDVKNLPDYFDRMVDAEPADGDAVEVTANVHGESEEGEAWFKVDQEAQRVSWGSEGPNGYHGELRVSGDQDSSVVSVSLHTERVETDEIDEGLRTTLANIKRLVEAGNAS